MLDGVPDTGAKFGAAGLQRKQKRRVDLFDMDAPILDGLDVRGGFEELARGDFRVGVGILRSFSIHRSPGHQIEGGLVADNCGGQGDKWLRSTAVYSLGASAQSAGADRFALPADLWI
ncbi:hypothetical protein [Bradyrhizobium arachidis]|uniref:hypothetical protein n=1 Tax=Bradyrhizobium arachidis TaxID=858423 RepID=UPI00142E1D46